MKLLVTGGAGYVGSVCAARLVEAGHEVVVVDDLSTGHADAVPDGCKFVEADIAEAAAMSVRTLTRRFTAEVGQSPIQWLAGVRIRHAQELLETTDHSIERIARQVGFSSPSAFRDQFRRATRVSPSEYRATFSGRPPYDNDEATR